MLTAHCDCGNKITTRDESRAVTTEYGVTTRVITETIACRHGVQVTCDFAAHQEMPDGQFDLLASVADPRSVWRDRMVSWDDYTCHAEQELVDEVMRDLEERHGMRLDRNVEAT